MDVAASFLNLGKLHFPSQSLEVQLNTINPAKITVEQGLNHAMGALFPELTLNRETAEFCILAAPVWVRFSRTHIAG
jgi:hypothetical protein